MFIVERAQQLKSLVEAITKSAAMIVKGGVKTAAGWIEEALARAIPVAIGFLARLLGLGGISAKVKAIITKLRSKVGGVIDKVIKKVAGFVKGIFGKAKAGVKKGVRKGREKVAQLIDWWRAKKSFTAKGGVTHTLYFSGKGKEAQLMIASPGGVYTQFMLRLTARDKRQREAKKKAVDIARQIDALKRKDPMIGMQSRKVPRLLSRLATLTAIVAAKFVKTPPSVIRYGGVNEQGGGKWMDAKILSKKAPKGGPPVDKPPIWTMANRRKGAFVQGHLLNEGFGGPGRAYNLTPITISANAKHRTIEAKVREELNKGKVLRYKVKVVYEGHGALRGFHKALRDRIRKLKRPRNKDRQKLKWADDEHRYLATRLEIDWWLVKHEGDGWAVDKKQPHETVENKLPPGHFGT